jgi:hypothetical protein
VMRGGGGGQLLACACVLRRVERRRRWGRGRWGEGAHMEVPARLRPQTVRCGRHGRRSGCPAIIVGRAGPSTSTRAC